MKITGVKIRSWEKPEDFNSRDLEINEKDYVIVETEQGLEAGEVVYLYDAPQETAEDWKPILRKAIESDLKKLKHYQKRKEEIFEVAKEKIEKHDLPMKLVDIHFAFDGSKITFAFTAEGRVDFRDLLKDLTRHFQKSIRLQQIGSRDEAKGLGGFGMCGREICCARFLDELQSITADMVRLQEMTQKGSEKNSGLCGRLKCCLAYEAEAYGELAKGMPEIDEEVKTERGKGRVISRNLLGRKIRVKLNQDGTEIDLDFKSKKR